MAPTLLTVCAILSPRRAAHWQRLAHSIQEMRIIKGNEPICSVEAWGHLPGPKSTDQWVEGRSAFELARASGTLAFARATHASYAVLVVHEFVTDKTEDHRHAHDAQDLRAFVHRLGGQPTSVTATGLAGPFALPGKPLFTGAPALFIGKVTTSRRLGA